MCVANVLYSRSVRSTTSSFRIPDGLRDRLDETAKHLKKGKNWIINQALDEYLRKWHREALASEARRQSILANEASTSEDVFWADQVDTRGWK